MRGTRHWIVIGLVALLALGSVAAGCGSSGDDTSSSSTTASGGSSAGDDLGLITPGTLTVGSDIPYPPFEQGKPPDYTGFDIDLVDAIAEKLGLDTDIVDTSFATIFSDQQAGKFDIVASSTTITPARQKKVTFSDPYFNADQSLMVQKGGDLTNTDGITSDTRIAVQEGDRRGVRRDQDRRPGAGLSGHRDCVQRAAGRPGRGGHQRLPGLRLRPAKVSGPQRRPDDSDGRGVRLPDAEDQHG